MQKLSRRDFLKGAAASAIGVAAMGLSGCGSPAANNTSASPQPGKNTAGTPSFLTAPAKLTEKDCASVIECDVCILGAGNSGCAAAVSCVQQGFDVVVLEKTASLAGRGGGIGLCNTKFVEAEGKKTDVEQHQNIWIQRCGSRVNEALVSMWFNNGASTYDWLQGMCDKYGVTCHSFRAYAPNTYVPESYDYHCFSDTAGKTKWPKVCTYFMATNVCYMEAVNDKAHPAAFHFLTAANQLMTDDSGAVVGVIATQYDKDGKETGKLCVKTRKGVVMATGGIHGNQEMVDYYCDANAHRYLECQCTPINASTGDGLAMGIWAGAHVQDKPFPLMLHPQAGAMYHGCFPFINAEGNRFMNEATWVQGKSMNVMHQTGYTAYSIFDANNGKYNYLSLKDGKGGGMFWDSLYLSLEDPFTDKDLDKQLKADLDSGNTVQANTLEELAGKIKVDPAKLTASISRYNKLVAAGGDEDFHKPANFLFPVDTAPFYAAKVGVALLSIVGGLSINTDLQVLKDPGEGTRATEPIKGLYATGNVSGDLYAIDYPINMAGNSNGRCFIWGHLMGKKIAKTAG